jgi:hypothetical protein
MSTEEMYRSLVVNSTTLAAEPNISLSGPNHKRIGEILEINNSHLWLQLPHMSPVFIYAIELYAISSEDLFSAKVHNIKSPGDQLRNYFHICLGHCLDKDFIYKDQG